MQETPSGYMRLSSWRAIANKQLDPMHKFLGEIGLSPASRSRVSTMPSLRPKPWEYGKFAGLIGAPRGRNGEYIGDPAHEFFDS